ncbi:MAG: butyrate kinase [Candidatus Edwardsbacteria bacterium]
MKRRPLILVINPGSTSTKVALFQGEKLRVEETIRHEEKEISSFSHIADQYLMRKQAVEEFLKRNKISAKDLNAVVGRGGLLKPLSAGTYRVNEEMLKDLREAKRGEHASNLGAIIAREIADESGAEAYIVDPVSVDEFSPLARISGLAEIERKSLLHALNMRATAIRGAKDLKKKLRNINLVIVHLGGGISIAPVEKGKFIDVNNANEGGPFSPERAGTLPTVELIKLCYSGKYTEKEMLKKINGKGGFISHLGTNDCREIEERVNKGDEKASLIVEAMAYQIAKEIGAYVAVLKGKVDAIVITGGLANFKRLIDWIRQRVNWIAPVKIYPGEDEMQALALGALRVIKGEEKAKEY